MNAVFIAAFLLLLVATVGAVHAVHPHRDPLPVLMALTNVVGVLFVIVFLGAGVAQVPVELWRQSDRRYQISKMEHDAVAVWEEWLEAEAALAETVSDVWACRVDDCDAVYHRMLVQSVPFVVDCVTVY